MKHLFPGAALIAALAFTAPLGAQPANPSGGNSMGMPGPSPGGPGLTPYSASPSAGPSPGDSALSGPRTPPPAGRGLLGTPAVLDVRHQFGDAAKAPRVAPCVTQGCT